MAKFTLRRPGCTVPLRSLDRCLTIFFLAYRVLADAGPCEPHSGGGAAEPH